jgi:hypothetical protein
MPHKNLAGGYIKYIYNKTSRLSQKLWAPLNSGMFCAKTAEQVAVLFATACLRGVYVMFVLGGIVLFSSCIPQGVCNINPFDIKS